MGASIWWVEVRDGTKCPKNKKQKILHSRIAIIAKNQKYPRLKASDYFQVTMSQNKAHKYW